MHHENRKWVPLYANLETCSLVEHGSLSCTKARYTFTVAIGLLQETIGKGELPVCLMLMTTMSLDINNIVLDFG